MPCKIEITKGARNNLADLPSNDRNAVHRALERLAQDPAGVDLAKLVGTEDKWRMRVGRRRVRPLLDNVSVPSSSCESCPEEVPTATELVRSCQSSTVALHLLRGCTAS